MFKHIIKFVFHQKYLLPYKYICIRAGVLLWQKGGELFSASLIPNSKLLIPIYLGVFLKEEMKRNRQISLAFTFIFNRKPVHSFLHVLNFID